MRMGTSGFASESSDGFFSFGFTFPLCKMRTVTPTRLATLRSSKKLPSAWYGGGPV